MYFFCNYTTQNDIKSCGNIEGYSTVCKCHRDNVIPVTWKCYEYHYRFPLMLTLFIQQPIDNRMSEFYDVLSF